MVNFLIAVGIYFLLLNIVTTFRLIKDDTLDFWQKFFQVAIVWIIPVLGSVFIALLLNAFPYERKGFFQEHPILTRILSLFFFVGVEKTRYITGYPSDSNFYTDAEIGWGGRRELESLSEIGGDASGE